MRYPVLASLFVLAASIASGTLECNDRQLTVTQRHGAELYGRMCAVCHGENGEGYKADQAPAIAHQAFLTSVSDELLRAAITNGRTGTTMSAWGVVRGGPLARADVDAVIAFMRTWTQRPRATLDEKTMAGNSVRGAETYAHECVTCHGGEGKGGPNIGIGNPELLGFASNGFLRMAIRGGRSGTGMPRFDQTLGDARIDDVIAALRGWGMAATAQQKPPAPARPPPIPLGPVPLNPRGPEPAGFVLYPGTTKADVIKAELDRGAKMAILDARAPSDYAFEHISGAVSVPFYEPDPYFKDLPKDAWLVAYCACPHAESRSLAQKLTQNGFKNVTVLDEGLGVWRSKKYGTHKGQAP